MYCEDEMRGKSNFFVKIDRRKLKFGYDEWLLHQVGLAKTSL